MNDPVRKTVINAALNIILLASQSLYPKDLVILAWNLELKSQFVVTRKGIHLVQPQTANLSHLAYYISCGDSLSVASFVLCEFRPFSLLSSIWQIQDV